MELVHEIQAHLEVYFAGILVAVFFRFIFEFIFFGSNAFADRLMTTRIWSALKSAYQRHKSRDKK